MNRSHHHIPVDIRTGRVEDAAELAALGAQTFTEAYTGNVPAEDLTSFVAARFSADLQAGEMADRDAAFLIAEANGAPVAYAYIKAVSREARTVLEVVRLYAQTEWIGKGVGRALMEACVAEAARRDADVLRLAVWQANARALSFYRRCGFVEVGQERFLLGRQPQVDVVMERPTRLRDAPSGRGTPVVGAQLAQAPGPS